MEGKKEDLMEEEKEKYLEQISYDSRLHDYYKEQQRQSKLTKQQKFDELPPDKKAKINAEIDLKKRQQEINARWKLF